MLKIYGSELCPDCVACKKNFDAYGIEYEYIDINKDLKDLKAFLKLRDSDPVFDPCKAGKAIGIPALIKEDGSIFLNWEDYLKENGHDLIEEGQACSLDGKGC